MSIFDRIILALYTVLMAMVSILTILCSLGVFHHENLIHFINSIPGNWVFAVSGVAVLLVSLRLLMTGLGISGQSSLKLSDGPNGQIYVGRAALEDYVAQLAQEIYGIHNVKVIAKLDDNAINVRINASIEPGINIPDSTGEIKSNVKETIKKVTGIEVKEIEVFFKQIKAKDA